MQPDLRTTYLGLALPSPLVASASPLTRDPAVVQALQAHGAGACVLPSLFEEQIEHDALEMQNLYDLGADAVAESLSYFPETPFVEDGVDAYVRMLEQTKQAVSIPIIASLNGASAAGWVHHAARLATAGADALELNVYFVPTDVAMDSAAVERRYLDVVEAVRREITIPLAVKVGPYFSSMPAMAKRLVDAGADGLVLFNRFLEPDIDLETLAVEPALELSTPTELRLGLRWIGILRDQLECSLAATSGVHAADDAVKAIISGADSVMVASTLLQNGVERLRDLVRGLEAWLAEHEYESVGQLRGAMSRRNSPDPSAFERSNYMRALLSYSD